LTQNNLSHRQAALDTIYWCFVSGNYFLEATMYRQI